MAFIKLGSHFFISRPENVGRQDFNSIHFVRLLLLNNSWLVLGCISVSNIPFSKFIVVRWGCSGTFFFLELSFTYAAGEFHPGVAGKSRTRKKKKKKRPIKIEIWRIRKRSLLSWDRIRHWRWLETQRARARGFDNFILARYWVCKVHAIKGGTYRDGSMTCREKKNERVK